MADNRFSRRNTTVAYLVGLILASNGFLDPAWAITQPEAGATWATNVYPLGVNGTNIEIAFVEAYEAPYTYRINPTPTNGWKGGYWPSTNIFTGKTILYYDDGDPLNTNYSGHATGVAFLSAGNPVPGHSPAYIGTAHGATTIHNIAADHFMNHYIGLHSNPPGQVFSLAFATPTNNQESWTAAFDRLVDAYRKVFVMGLPTTNASVAYGGVHPAGLASSFNIITVGCADGSYTNWGKSTQYGPAAPHGTAKPDLLTAANSGSEAAGRGAGIAALLVNQATRDGWTNGSDPRVIKAIMLAGARKTTPWDKGLPGPDDDHAVPLDYYAGAGIAHCLQNYGIMYGGEIMMGSTNVRAAWDLGEIGVNQSNVYFVSTTQSNIYMSIALAWHRHVGATTNMQDLDLRLYSFSGATTSIVDWSTSRIDSVEHIYCMLPSTGMYAIVVDGQFLSTTEVYALAFNLVGTPENPLNDADADGLPDNWEGAYFGEIYFWGHADDPDDDGADNFAEFMADTAPTNHSSVFELNVAAQTNLDFAIAFLSSTSRRYKIEFYDDFYATNLWIWSEATTNWFDGNGGWLTWVDDGSETGLHPSQVTGRIYRAKVSLK